MSAVVIPFPIPTHHREHAQLVARERRDYLARIQQVAADLVAAAKAMQADDATKAGVK